MISTETGVYLQFFDEGEPTEKELPPLGPFELLIIRHNRIIGDREQVEHDMMGLGSVERWLEAELELRRALGDEPGGVRRGHMRIRAPRGDIIVRFYDYAGDEPPKVPELGPFYALTVGKREVRADDKLLAIRSTDMSPWTLTDQVRPGIAGINKADFSVFSLSARDPRAQARPAAPAAAQPSAPSAPAPAPVAPAPASGAPIVPPAALDQNGAPGSAAPAEFTERRKIQREVYVARPLPQRDEQLTPADVNLILRVDKLKQQELAEQLMIERLRREQHVAPETALRAEAAASVPMRFQPPVKERVAAEAAAEEYEDESFTQRFLGFLWSARIVLVTALVLVALVAAYGYLQAPSSPLAGPKALTYATVNERIQTNDWTITVTSVDRLGRLGPTPPSQGQYLVVHVTASRKTSDAPPLDPTQFILIDPNGARVFAFPPTADMYNPSSGVTWPSRFPIGTSLPGLVIFDVNPSAKGLQLFIKPANVQVRLPDAN